MRRQFFKELYKQMTVNNNVWALTGDLGYIGFDKIRDNYSKRFINCGASETAMLDIAVGLAYDGKIPFVYSITPFLIYRPFEVLRTYINHEKLNVKLCASGRDFDYEIDGYSHHSPDVKQVLDCLPNIEQHFPMDKKEIPNLVSKMVKVNTAQFISLRR